MTTESEIERRQAKVAEMEKKLAKAREDLSKAQLEQWSARIDEFEVQLHLHTMEVRDELQPMVDRLRAQWGEAKRLATQLSTPAADALVPIRHAFEHAIIDIRDGVAEARAAAGKKVDLAKEQPVEQAS